MPRGGIFDADTSNSLTLSGSKTQLQARFSGKDFALRNMI